MQIQITLSAKNSLVAFATTIKKKTQAQASIQHGT
jgi:hypothetical protein